MNIPATDTINRTALIGAYNSAHSTLESALAAQADTGIAIVADVATCASPAGQAALCTAIATAVRAFGTVIVVGDGQLRFTAGPYRTRTLTEVAAAEGALFAADLSAALRRWPILLVGPTSVAGHEDPADRDVVLQVGWTGWTAHVQPIISTQLQPQGWDGNVLAAIAASALGVHEAFAAVQGRPGSDSGHRAMRLNLWRPGSDVDDGPPLSYAPGAWWLVGLGHLGQANAWVIAWLTYADPSSISIVLQDTDKAVEANHSTGLLTPRRPYPVRKTRIVAATLDTLGYDTALVERRLDNTFRRTEADHHVALIGVDNLPTRRRISTVRWPLAIDAGLGAGPSDYNAILLRRFPATRPSDQIPAWAEQPQKAHTLPFTPAFDDLKRRDSCGVVEVAGTAVGAAFVGVTAACLAVAETIRTILGGDGHDVINLHLQSSDLETAPASSPTDVVPARLLQAVSQADALLTAR